MDDERLSRSVGGRKISDRNVSFDDLVGDVAEIAGVGSVSFDLDRCFLEISLAIGSVFLCNGIQSHDVILLVIHDRAAKQDLVFQGKGIPVFHPDFRTVVDVFQMSVFIDTEQVGCFFRTEQKDVVFEIYDIHLRRASFPYLFYSILYGIVRLILFPKRFTLKERTKTQSGR